MNNHYHFIKSVSYGGVLARFVIENRYLFDYLEITGKDKFAFECLLANGFNSIKDPACNGWVAVSLDENEYKKNRIYKDLSYTSVKRMMEYLESDGFIEIKKGYTNWNSRDAGRRTIYRLLPRLLSFVEGELASCRQVDTRIGKSIYKNKKNKKIISRWNDEEEEKLKFINTQQSLHNWSAGVSPQYYKVNFDDDGGRVYCSLQNLSRQDRSLLLVNDEQTVELDFISSHISIIFSLENLSLDQDPYLIFGNEYRNLIKKIMNISLNTCSLSQLKKVIVSNKELLTLLELLPNHLLPRKTRKQHTAAVLSASEKIEEIVKIILEKYPVLHKWMFKESGYRLMGIEGEIALEVMEEASRKNIPVLNIHDGYITGRSYKKDLLEILITALRKRSLMVGIAEKEIVQQKRLQALTEGNNREVQIDDKQNNANTYRTKETGYSLFFSSKKQTTKGH